MIGLIISIYGLLNLAIIIYIVLKNERVDREYREKLREIYNKEWKL